MSRSGWLTWPTACWEREALVFAGDTGDEQTGGDMVASRLYVLSLSIAAGTSEIQRNIIGERILGLPKER